MIMIFNVLCISLTDSDLLTHMSLFSFLRCKLLIYIVDKMSVLNIALSSKQRLFWKYTMPVLFHGTLFLELFILQI